MRAFGLTLSPKEDVLFGVPPGLNSEAKIQVQVVYLEGEGRGVERQEHREADEGYVSEYVIQPHTTVHVWSSITQDSFWKSVKNTFVKVALSGKRGSQSF